MLTITLFAALFSLALTFGVLWANPHRFSNQVFSLAALFQTAWLACVYRAIQAGASIGETRTAELEFWFRGNAAIISFLPASIWLLKNAILFDQRKKIAALYNTFPIILLSVASMILCYSDSFVSQGPSLLLVRGLSYYVFIIISLTIYGTCIAKIMSQIGKYSGIRRVELQFLALNAGGAALLLGVLNALGNLLQYRALNRLSILLVFAASALTAWALLFHRVFNAREVLIQLCQRGTFILALCGGTYLLWGVTHGLIAEPFGLVLSVGVCGSAAVWLDRRSRSWFDGGSRRKLAVMRRAAIEIGSNEMQTDKLVARLEALLQTESNAQFATLLFDNGEAYSGSHVSLPKHRPGFAALLEMGWTTPESLLRRKANELLADLQDLVDVHSIGLLISTPRGSPTPSMIIALGKRTDESPFTYPEIERMQTLVGLFDNLVARSRRASHAALHARLEYLAMASRGLAHDMKNLVTPVSSFLLHTDGLFFRDSPAGEVHAAALRATRVMSDYVRENLFFSEKLTPHLEQAELDSLFDRVRDIAEPQTSNRRIILETVNHCQKSVVADRVLIQRMLSNLVTNAIDASPEGSTITLSARETQVGWIRIDVSDQGSGIAPENLSRIFDPYFTTKEFGDEMRGFGLGLTIAQKIVLLHQGNISVASRPGQGTTFTVELPVAQPSALTIESPAAAPGRSHYPCPAHVMT